MHDARNRGSLLGLHHEHVAAGALGDDLLLQMLRRVLAAQIRFEGRPQAAALLPKAIADDPELGARVVDHFAGRIDLRGDVCDFGLERRGAIRRGEQPRERRAAAPDGGARIVDRREEPREREQPSRLERARLHRQRRNRLGQIFRRPERKPLTGGQEADRFARLGQTFLHHLRVGRRLQPGELPGAERSDSERLHGVDNPLEFECPKGAWLHRGWERKDGEPLIVTYRLGAHVYLM
ncbi:MAG TPA: hypothetical protein VEI94_04980 [Candidatus Bathyarchaeia archaeon]|nr:hypothetical protein [Candidatus Bathyarchaeia archaeon]